MSGGSNLSTQVSAKADLMGHATLLRDVYVGRGGVRPQAVKPDR